MHLEVDRATVAKNVRRHLFGFQRYAALRCRAQVSCDECIHSVTTYRTIALSADN